MELLDDNLFAYPDSARLFNEIDFYENINPFKLRNGLDCREYRGKLKLTGACCF